MHPVECYTKMRMNEPIPTLKDVYILSEKKPGIKEDSLRFHLYEIQKPVKCVLAVKEG